MGSTGREQKNINNTQSLCNKELKEKTQNTANIKEVHNQEHILEKYPELTTIIVNWPELPERIRQAIKVLIENHKGK